MKFKNLLLSSLLILCLSFGFTACSDKNKTQSDQQSTGATTNKEESNVDKNTEELKDDIKDSTENIGDDIADVGDEIKDGVDDMINPDTGKTDKNN